MIGELLKDLKVIDFSARLPGPLGSMVLGQLGAKIIKIENKQMEDPFNNPELHAINPCFRDWYKNLNQGKEVVLLDFEKDIPKIIEIAKDADAFIIPHHEKFEAFIKMLGLQPKVIIMLAGGEGQWRSLHDLNALALSKTFELHLQDTKHPPYLPFAGIAFGQYIATTLLAALFQSQRSNETIQEIVYLKDITENIFDALYSETYTKRPRQLHNGIFPSYSIYRSKDDQIICLAAVEEKYWNRLIQTFNLPLNLEDRFDTSGKTANILENTFKKLVASAIKEKIQNQDVCLTLLEK